METGRCAGCRERDERIRGLQVGNAALEQGQSDLRGQLWESHEGLVRLQRALADHQRGQAQLKRRLAQQRQDFQHRLDRQQRRIEDLEARLKTNSTNSSRPPSTDPPSAPKRRSRKPTGRKRGGQKGHPGHGRPRLPADEIIRHVPQQCQRCQAPLSVERGPTDPAPTIHQVITIPPKLVHVTEHQAHSRWCAVCGHVSRGKIPAEVMAHGFGSRLTALIGFLSGRCRASKRIIVEMLEDVFGIPISLGSVSKAESEVSSALAGPYASAEAAVRSAPVKNADETGWALAGRLCWLWMAVTSRVALFKVCGGRGHKALRAFLGSAVQGIVGSDRLWTYGIIDLFRRQVCWAHLKRDFQKWVDVGGPAKAIGEAGLQGVKEIFEMWGRFREGVVDRPGLQTALERVSHDLYRSLQTGQTCPNEKTARFCRNLIALYPALWTFTRVEGVEPTNNVAERMLRPAVIWRKLCFGNQSEAGCRFTERILTVAQTLRLQHRHVLAYLHHALAAHRAGQPAPNLLSAGP